MDSLRISQNGRYFLRPDGTPFPWIADTAWTVPARLKWDDVLYYLKTRKRQGFTVLQMVVLDPEFNPEMKNPSGIPALKNGKLQERNPEYFDYVDWVLDQAEREGFYVLLLPVWGQLVTGDDWGGGHYEKVVNETNAFEYGAWLGEREKKRSNLLWCLGGDRMPIHKGTDYRMVWRKMAEGLAYGLTGERLAWNQNPEKWSRILMTYHTCHEMKTGKCSTFSYWTKEDVWIRFTMLQSGHGLSVRNDKLIQQEYNEHPAMPVWEGESAYEDMPTQWPITANTTFHGADVVMKKAYPAMFSGAFGYTYGHASVWCTISEKEINEVTRKTWTEALNSEGVCQVKVLRDFLETFPAETFVPCGDLCMFRNDDGEDSGNDRQVCVSEDGRLLLIYFHDTSGCEMNLRMLWSGERNCSKIEEERAGRTDIDLGCRVPDFQYAWFDPSNGRVSRSTFVSGVMVIDGWWKVPGSVTGNTKDVVLIVKFLDSEGKDQIPCIEVPSGTYGEEKEKTLARKVFEW